LEYFLRLSGKSVKKLTDLTEIAALTRLLVRNITLNPLKEFEN